MFTVYHSNQLDLLKSLLLHFVKTHPLASPLQAEQILVQSPGMAQWLKIEIAKEQGIVANMDFPLPATFIWRMFVKTLEKVPESSFFNKEAMTWKLIKLLPMFKDDPDFDELNRYLAEDDSGQKIFQLAGKIADIFDQYLVYRPEWIKAWEADEKVEEIEGVMPWQKKLWQSLYHHTVVELEQSSLHRANLYEKFINTLLESDEKPQGLEGIERVFIFGISALPPRYLDALRALGKHIDVHYMFTNPCRSYWGDIKDRAYLAKRDARRKALHQTKLNLGLKVSKTLIPSWQETELEVGNSFLASTGKLGRDNLSLLVKLMYDQGSEQDFVREIEAFSDIKRSTLLRHIQADMLDLLEPGDVTARNTSKAKTQIDTSDNSIRVEICHSPMREVEVLHDRLLAMFEQNPNLTPRDIIVMVADIEDYSPAIRAVFGSAPNERFIPFAISDRSAEQESPVLSTFLHLLSLPISRCSANELLEILQLPAVLRRFNLNEQEFEKIKYWIEEAGIRWGLNESTACQFDLPLQNENTWVFGLHRMLLGYALPSEAGFFAGIKPYDEVQGLTADIAGKLAEFVQVLLNGQKNLSTAKTGQAWLAMLSKLFDDIFLLETEEELAGKIIRDTLDAWVLELENSRFERNISLVVVKEYLKDKLSVAGVSQRFLAGQVNFCTLMPMRSIPFEVVCLLGMNDADYPRSVAPVGFDLMNTRARPGDRSRRDDDRYLFLEALLSAQSHLYISYAGRSIQDNSEKVPSVLLSELLQYCTQGYCLAGDKALTDEDSTRLLREHLITENSLTPFSPKAFAEQSSYAREWLPVAKGITQKSESFFSKQGLVRFDDSHLLELSELQRFYRLPVKYFFNRVLQVYFENQDASISDTEPFSLDSLERYKLREALLTHLLKHDDEEESINAFFKDQRAEGNLPLHYFGELVLEKEQQEIIALAATLTPLLEDKSEALELNLSLTLPTGQIQLQGWLKNLYCAGQILYRGGKLKAPQILNTWINHLCLCAMGCMLPTYFFAVDKSIKFAAIDAQHAKELLTSFIAYFYQGLEKPLIFLPKTAYAAIEAEVKDKDAFSAALKEFEGNSYKNIPGEKDDAYVARLWPELDKALLDDMQLIAGELLLPLINALSEVEE